MNRITLRLLLLTGLAAIFCASCNKDMDFLDIPDAYERIPLPFSVDTIPKDGCDSLSIYRIKIDDILNLKEKLDLTDTTTKFKQGDSIIMEAYPKNGYTFINWVRDGKGVSNNPIYGFRLDTLDIDPSTHFVKHHYEARFGLDYALQVIPPIDSVIPIELIKAMGPYLHFGDNPPTLYKMRNDTILGFYAQHPILLDYYAVDSTADVCSWCFVVDPNTGHNQLPKPRDNWDYFLFHDQHRGIAQFNYKCLYYEQSFVIGDENIDIKILDTATIDVKNTFDDVYIMGNSSGYFTAYYRQFRDRVISVPPNSPINIPSQYPNPGGHEAIILSGRITDNGVEDVHFGIMFVEYDNLDDVGISFSNVGDIVVFYYDFLPFSYWNPKN